MGRGLEKNMGGRALVFVCALFVFVSVAVVAEAKFTCEVISVDGARLVLENCKDGIRRIKPGDTVSIIKKRKKAAEEKGGGY